MVVLNKVLIPFDPCPEDVKPEHINDLQIQSILKNLTMWGSLSITFNPKHSCDDSKTGSRKEEVVFLQGQ